MLCNVAGCPASNGRRDFVLRLILPAVACLIFAGFCGFAAGYSGLFIGLSVSVCIGAFCSSVNCRPSALSLAPVSRAKRFVYFALCSVVSMLALFVSLTLIVRIVEALLYGAFDGFFYPMGGERIEYTLISIGMPFYCIGGCLFVCYKTTSKALIVRSVIFVVLSLALGLWLYFWDMLWFMYHFALLTDEGVAWRWLPLSVYYGIGLGVCLAVFVLGMVSFIIKSRQSKL